MKPAHIVIAAAALSVVAGVGLTPAAAQWWNPFRREAPAAAAPQPLPPPPATITGAPTSPPAAQAGAPLQLPLPPANVGVVPAQPTPAGVAAVQQPPAASGPANSGELAVRIDRIEAQMRSLTGQVEELTHQLQLLQRELATLDGGPLPPDRRADAAATDALPAERLAAAPTVLRPTPTRVPPAAAPGPGDRTTAATAAPGVPFDLRFPVQTAAITPTGDPQRDYAAAYGHVLAGEYDLAEIGFRAFLSSYPADEMAADAQFWVGETLFTRGRFREAADEFLAGYNTYPQSAKRPETLLKLGQSLAGLGERATACETYSAVLRQFPQAPNAVRERVQAEQAGARC